LDVWFRQAEPLFQGRVRQVRYCDDAVFLFSSKVDAERFAKALQGRTERFGLELHPEKTQLLKMDKRGRAQGVRQPTFSFLGFTFFLGFSRKGGVIPKIRTDAQKMRKKVREIAEWLKKVKHLCSMRQIWDQLRRKVRGYQEYFNVSQNTVMVGKFVWIVVKIFFKAMNRRSQKKSLSWEKFDKFRKVHPMPAVPVKKILFS
jgi:RNA-directed DNA polymerase